VAKQREWAEDTSTTWWQNKRRNRRLAPSRAMTELEALLELAPGQQPITPSLAETNALREVVADAVDALPEEDQWIFNVLHVAGLSLRFILQKLPERFLF